MNQTVEKFFNSAKVMQEQQRAMYEARESYRTAKAEVKATKLDFIRTLAYDFVEKMKHSYNKNAYIRNGYSDTFTRYVSRMYGKGFYSHEKHKGTSEKHYAATRAFNEAFENLNAVFVEEISNNPAFFEFVVENAGLKNLDKLSKDETL